MNSRVHAVTGLLLCVLMLRAAASWPADADDKLATFPRQKVTSIIDNVRRISSDSGIEELKSIAVGGIQQWISVRGRSRTNPILLFIHGGPASTEMPASWIFQSGWEDYFTVVQWDQRGAGKTYVANDPAAVGPTIHKEKIIADAAEVIQYLRTTYGQDKVFVLGHSWGSIIGMEIARRYPQWLYAYIGMGQIINMRENERLGYEFTLRAATAAANQQALTELRGIAPYPAADGSLPLEKINVQRKWSVAFGGLTHGRTRYDYYPDATELSPDYSVTDVEGIDQGSALSLPRLLPEMAQVDFDSLVQLHCPVVIFNGRHDDTTSAVLAARWFQKLHAPAKRLVWFENSAHMIHVEEPGRVLVHLVNDVRPFAKVGQRATD